MSEWFRAYGFADVHDDLLIGAYPLDDSDVRMLERIGVRRILNLVQDQEYAPGQREQVEATLVASGIQETRLALEDYGRLPPEALETAVQEIVNWLRAGERTYVHCRAGWQRSAAVAAGVVAILDDVEIGTALARVQIRKPSARPLADQNEDLLRWWEMRAGDPQAEQGDSAAAGSPRDSGISGSRAPGAANTGGMGKPDDADPA